MSTAQWQLEGVDYGEAPAHTKFRHGAVYDPVSVAYFCPACGDIWGRITVAGQPFASYPRYCPQHGPGFALPYSNQYEAPLAILKREVLLISQMQHPERYDIALIFGKE